MNEGGFLYQDFFFPPPEGISVDGLTLHTSVCDLVPPLNNIGNINVDYLHSMIFLVSVRGFFRL